MIKFLYFANDNSHAVFCSTMARLSAHYGYDVRCLLEGVNLANPVLMKQFNEHRKSTWMYYSGTIIAPLLFLEKLYTFSKIKTIEYNFSNQANYKCLTIDSDGIKANTLFEYFVNNHDDWFQLVEYYDYNCGRFEHNYGPGYFAKSTKSKERIIELMTQQVEHKHQEWQTKLGTALRFEQLHLKAVEDLYKAKALFGI
jgi:hypothetical protein